MLCAELLRCVRAGCACGEQGGGKKAFASLAGRKQSRGTGGICRARLRLSRWESSRRSRVRGLYGFLCVLRPLPSRRRLQTCFAHSQIPLRRTSYATALFSAKPTGVLRAFANLPQSERLKRNTQNNNRSYFCLLDKSRLRSYRKVCISFPITKASFAFLQKNVRADNKKLYIVPDN